jgi:hypothetical protein
VLAGEGQRLVALLYRKDVETRVLDRAKECIELEITDVLGTWRHNISGVQIVPNPVNFANRDPVIALVADESVARICEIPPLQRGNRHAPESSSVLERHFEHWKRVVSRVCDIVAKMFTLERLCSVFGPFRAHSISRF